MGKFTESNIEKIGKSLSGRGLGSRVSESAAVSIAGELWKSVLSFIDGNNLSWDHKTFNLRDSIGCGVYKDGVLVTQFFSNPKGMNSFKYFTYHKNHIKANGWSRIRKAIMEEPYDKKGINIVFRCALAYGLFLEYGLGPAPYPNGNPSKKGYGWWSNQLVPYIKSEFERIVGS